jgi:2-polyprenyl-3-methyl-5-hydroxy-6-metoxy-1,4-benzoquinol methylase
MLSDAMRSAILSRYPRLGRLTRFHLDGRLRRCPYDSIATLLPPNPSLLDIGCGFGHFAWFLLESGACSGYTGTDIDPYKITVAQSSLKCSPAQAAPCPLFLLGTPFSLALNDRYDAITLIDVLYLLPWDMQQRLLEWCFSHLSKKTGAVIIAKNPDTTAGARLYGSYVQEWIMVHVMGRTASSGTVRGARSVETYQRLCQSSGMDLTHVRLSSTGLLLLFRHC